MAQKKSDFRRGWGKMTVIVNAVIDAILAAGGDDDDVARLETLAPQIAAMSIAARPPKPEEEVVEEVPAQPVVPAYPQVGEVFELTFDGDAPENQPLEIVRYFGYNPEGWKHKGLRVGGKQTCRFKLVQVGYCRNLDEVKERLKKYGKIPGGQWLKAFKMAYPQPDGNGPIGVADSSWVNPDGLARFPVVGSGGDLRFGWAGVARGDRWRWLVAVE